MTIAHNTERLEYASNTITATRRVDSNAPLRWLKNGASDFSSAPFLSLSYGLVFALLAMGASFAATQEPQLALTLLAGLLVAGPFLAAGLYHASNMNGQDRRFSVRDTLSLMSHHKGRIAIYVLTMLLLTVAWIRISSIAVAVYYGQLFPDTEIFASSLSSADGIRFLAPLVITGTLFALLLFAASALALPLIVDGKAETIPALLTSLKTMVKQPATMLAWAGVVAALTFIGIATLFVGLIVIFPLLGYATWHSYRDMIRR
jgi:uncharacterized membrane protein